MTDSSPQAPPVESEYDKAWLHGKYFADVDRRVEQNHERRDWKDQLYRQMAHKSLDEPLLDEEEQMHIDARRSTVNSGVSGKGLIALAALLLPMTGLAGAGGLVLLNTWLNNQQTAPPPETDLPAVHQHEPQQDLIAVPSLQFGPER